MLSSCQLLLHLLWVTAAGSAAISAVDNDQQERNFGNLRSNQRKLQLLGSLIPDFICDWLPLLCSEAENCPTVKPLDKNSFDLDTYIEKTWYVQKQQLNQYQQRDDLYCIIATYDKRNDEKVQVYNYANQNRVNGPYQGTSQNGAQDLCARQVDAGEIRVAPCIFGIVDFIFDLAAGPYSVVAVSDPGTDNYEWAIISGGEPDIVKEEDPTLCTTSNGRLFTDALLGSGLWLFTRDQVANETTMQEMMGALDNLGIYAGDLKDVNQEGCLYTDAFIKS